MVPSEIVNLWNDTNNTVTPLLLTETTIEAARMMQTWRNHVAVCRRAESALFSYKIPIKWKLEVFSFRMSKQRIRGKWTPLHWVIYKLPGWILLSHRHTSKHFTAETKRTKNFRKATHKARSKEFAWDYLSMSGKLAFNSLLQFQNKSTHTGIQSSLPLHIHYLL